MPVSPQDWLALPEVGLGRHLVADLGWVSSRRERVVAAGVTDLPRPFPGVDDGFVSLPAVTVVGDDGQLRMFRLPIAYMVLVRRFLMHDERVGPAQALTGSVAPFPCHFIIGDRETVYLRCDHESTDQLN